MRSTTVNFRFEFVERIPQKMEEHVLYISLPFNMTMHLCPCGCGKEVANKISPTRWAMTYDGDTVSLEPSVRNSGIPCQSHYFITRNKIEWAFDLFEERGEKSKKRKKKFKFFWQK
jgi:hypothetical protein